MPSSTFWKKTNGKRTNSPSIFFNTESFVYVTTSHGTQDRLSFFLLSHVTTYPHPKTNSKRKFFAAFALLTAPETNGRVSYNITQNTILEDMQAKHTTHNNNTKKMPPRRSPYRLVLSRKINRQKIRCPAQHSGKKPTAKEQILRVFFLILNPLSM